MKKQIDDKKVKDGSWGNWTEKQERDFVLVFLVAFVGFFIAFFVEMLLLGMFRWVGK